MNSSSSSYDSTLPFTYDLLYLLSMLWGGGSLLVMVGLGTSFISILNKPFKSHFFFLQVRIRVLVKSGIAQGYLYTFPPTHTFSRFLSAFKRKGVTAFPCIFFLVWFVVSFSC